MHLWLQRLYNTYKFFIQNGVVTLISNYAPMASEGVQYFKFFIQNGVVTLISNYAPMVSEVVQYFKNV